MVRICFFLPNAYPLLAKNCTGRFGGAEVKMVLLSESLKDMGYEVCYITKEFIGYYDSKDKHWHKKGLKRYPKGKRLKFLFGVLNTIRSLYAVNADIYYQRAPGATTGIISLFCKLKKKIFCYMVASSQDADLNYIRSTNIRNRMLYEYGLKNANAVFTQTKELKELLFKNHGINSFFIRDGIKMTTNVQSKKKRKYITFIGGMRPVKNPEIFIKLAKNFPGNTFLMIGGSLTDESYYKFVKESAQKEKNIIFKGHLKRDKIWHYLSLSMILVNTSDREGLPNTITEAWSYGVPVIGLNINPDNLLNGDLGLYSKGDFNLLEEQIDTLINNNAMYKSISNRCVEYVINNHNIEKTSLEMDSVIKNLISKHLLFESGI